ncbi:MAG: type II CRISPR RNA-guided endonuclease Cas9, partial [Cytophagaceae bacterium]|nr:type II CRISPR RNA-guided endonuclease Cas9 [Cytophagaceae bacterium]
IIPQSRLFDDSFSNKTIELRSINLEKGNKTAYDFVKEKYGETGNDNSLDNYLNRIEPLFKEKKTKLRKLRMEEKDIPEGFIDRDLRNTQYIAKKALEMLNEICRRVVATTGSITDELREDWQLIDIMKELNWEKYDKLGLTETIEIQDKNNENEIHKVRRIKKEYWTKRNDHRHHAMDALTVAFTKDAFIQYYNFMNAKEDKSFSYTKEKWRKTFPYLPMPDKHENIYGIKTKFFENSRAIPPMPIKEFRAEAKKHLENTLISIKAKNKVVTKNINATKKAGKDNTKVQLTPRGQLHLETVYGSQKQIKSELVKIDGKMTAERIASVCNPTFREALLKRLQENSGDAKKAFAGKNAIAKNPIYYIDNEEHKVKMPEQVKCFKEETVYTIRKEISPDLKLDKVMDEGVKRILEARLNEYNGDAKKAFSNLEENPIYLNKEKNITIKRVTISGISNAESLHDKRDKDGNLILDKDGKTQPVDFVNTGNNHHVAVYRKPVLDKNGQPVFDENNDPKYELDENVVPFYTAVARINEGLPVIDKSYKADEGYEFLFSMKQNEYFVFPKTEKREKVDEQTGEITEEEVMTFNPKDIDLLNPDNYAAISKNLFRVQTVATKDYIFRHHLETNVDRNNSLKGIAWIRTGLNGIENIVKVRLNHIGQIVSVGEY